MQEIKLGNFTNTEAMLREGDVTEDCFLFPQIAQAENVNFMKYQRLQNVKAVGRNSKLFA